MAYNGIFSKQLLLLCVTAFGGTFWLCGTPDFLPLVGVLDGGEFRIQRLSGNQRHTIVAVAVGALDFVLKGEVKIETKRRINLKLSIYLRWFV